MYPEMRAAVMSVSCKNILKDLMRCCKSVFLPQQRDFLLQEMSALPQDKMYLASRKQLLLG